jgi:ABC-type multidrug transport system ATPase subunit
MGFGIIILGLFFILFLANGFGVYSWYQDGGIRPLMRFIFAFIPFFQFGKAFSDVVFLAVQQHYNNQQQGYGGPEGYTWADLYKKNLLTGNNGVTWDVPPTIDSVYLLLFDTALFYVLTWYCDNVVPQGESVTRPFYFFLMPSYWCGSGKTSASSARQAIEKQRFSETQRLFGAPADSDVVAETSEAFALNQDEDHLAIRIVNLRKTFQKSFFRKDDRKDVHAVRGFSLTCAPGQLLGLLGHNGAGKTTTISMLVGLYPPTDGEAFIFGMSVKHQMDEIRRVMGVCPQFDILWGDLTAREHLRLFSRMKKVPKDRIEKEIEERLADVDLDKVADNFVSSYSGGMKRRLSVAISMIGNPRVILLDEPSTGVDPQTRRNLWALIEKMKKDRVILLTSHNMAECEALCDRIAIMAFGQLRCIGDTLRLKSKFGDGYSISVFTQLDHVPTLLSAMHSASPSTSLKTNAGGNLIWQLPFDRQSELGSIFKLIERESGKTIQDWSIGHTSLEDVYLKITKESNFGFEAGMASNIQQRQAQDQHNSQIVHHQTVYVAQPSPQQQQQPVYYAQPAGSYGTRM